MFFHTSDNQRTEIMFREQKLIIALNRMQISDPAWHSGTVSSLNSKLMSYKRAKNHKVNYLKKWPQRSLMIIDCIFSWTHSVTLGRYSSAAIHPSPVLPVILDLPLKAMKDVMIFCKCIWRLRIKPLPACWHEHLRPSESLVHIPCDSL